MTDTPQRQFRITIPALRLVDLPPRVPRRILKRVDALNPECIYWYEDLVTRGTVVGGIAPTEVISLLMAVARGDDVLALLATDDPEASP